MISYSCCQTEGVCYSERRMEALKKLTEVSLMQDPTTHLEESFSNRDADDRAVNRFKKKKKRKKYDWLSWRTDSVVGITFPFRICFPALNLESPLTMMKKLLQLLFWEYHLSVYFKLFSAKRE